MTAPVPPRLNPLAFLIFSSRWLQLPLYLGLIVAQGVYVMLFLKELWHLLTHATSFGEMEIMLLVLGLIDVVMISNLLVMVIVGGYETFVSRMRLDRHPDQPEWLSHVNASVLKVKLAMAIIGISSIHLLKTFIEAGSLGALPICGSQAAFDAVQLGLPLYLGLIVAQGVYVFLFLKELSHLVTDITTLNEQQVMLLVLGLIDVVMISNLLMMVIVGGYETFVSRMRLDRHPDQPEWLSHVNASVLKVKLAMAIIGISSIHLLKTFIEIGNLGAPGSKLTESGVMWQTIIHCVFILSAIGIAWTDKLMQGGANGKHAAH